MKRILSAFCLCVSTHLIGNQIDSWAYPPETISSVGVDASDPHLGMDLSGNIVATWLENGELVSKTKLLNQSWDSLATISNSGVASSPQMVVDESGNAAAIWVESGSVKAATKLFNDSWSSVESLSTSDSSSPQIAVRDNGDLVAVWIESGTVKSKTKLFGQSWSATDTISSSGADSPQVAICNNGDAFIVWHAENAISLIETIYASKRPSGGSWSSASTISNTSENSIQPQIAADQSGNATAIWFTYSQSGSSYYNVHLKASTYSAATFTWDTPLQLSYYSSQKNPNELASQVIYNHTGLPGAAWTDSPDGSSFQIQACQRLADGSWTEPFTLATSLYAYSVNMAVSSVGDLFVAYMTDHTPTSSIVIATRESRLGGISAGAWTAPEILSEDASNGFARISAVVSNGTDSNAVAGWLSFNGSNNVLQTTTGSGSILAPPSDPAVTQSFNDFGIFKEYYNTLTWSASPDPNLVGYVIYRGNNLLTVIDTGTLEYVDNNQVQNGSVNYGISAIDSFGTESAIVTVSFP